MIDQLTFGPVFWGILALAVVLMIVVGLWLGQVIGRKTDSGIGAFFIHAFVTLGVAAGLLPLAFFWSGAEALLMGFAESVESNASLDQDAVWSGIAKVGQALGVVSLSVLVYFIAGLVGVARGRRDA